MSRYFEVRFGDSNMCLKILDDEELPCIRSIAGASFFNPVSVIQMTPWSVSRVKSGMRGTVLGVCLGSWDECNSVKAYGFPREDR